MGFLMGILFVPGVIVVYLFIQEMRVLWETRDMKEVCGNCRGIGNIWVGGRWIDCPVCLDTGYSDESV